MTMSKRWGTVADAVDHFGITRQRVHILLKKGALGDAKKIETPRGPVWLIAMPFQRKSLESGFHRPECGCGIHKKSKE